MGGLLPSPIGKTLLHYWCFTIELLYENTPNLKKLLLNQKFIADSGLNISKLSPSFSIWSNGFKFVVGTLVSKSPGKIMLLFFTNGKITIFLTTSVEGIQQHQGYRATTTVYFLPLNCTMKRFKTYTVPC